MGDLGRKYLVFVRLQDVFLSESEQNTFSAQTRGHTACAMGFFHGVIVDISGIGPISSLCDGQSGNIHYAVGAMAGQQCRVSFSQIPLGAGVGMWYVTAVELQEHSVVVVIKVPGQLMTWQIYEYGLV
jgi:hypothetical protein